MIPFRMKARLDLSERKKSGEQIDSREIRKHRSDVFRLAELLNPAERIQVPAAILQDRSSLAELTAYETFTLRQLNVRMTDNELFERLRPAYGLNKTGSSASPSALDEVQFTPLQ